MNLTIEEIALATNATVIRTNNSSETYSFSTDSRNINVNQLYLPLKGEKFDGHDFIESAVKNGACGYFVDDKEKIIGAGDIVFFVTDTKIAYLELARFYRRKINPVTIAITGSSGKTTTKEMMYYVASEMFKTVKTELNHNNEIGLCQTISSITSDTQVLIVEMGMRGLGEIELLSKYAEPDIALIANVGTAHIGRLGSLKNIAKAKCEITSYLHKEGVLVAHDTELIRKTNKFEGQNIYFGLDSEVLTINEVNQNSSSFEYKGQLYKLNLEGEHNIQNALGVIEIGIKLGMPTDLIAKGLEKFKPIEKRWEVEKVNGLNIINDSYNANPESVKAALKTFLSLYKNPKVVVLGDMGELGKNEKKYHIEIGNFLENYKYDYLVTVGALAKSIRTKTKHNYVHFKTNKDAAKFISKKVKLGSNILLKASRSMKFEEIIEELKEI